MDYSLVFLKKLYQTNRDIERLSERDRALLLFIIAVVSFGLWFYVPHYFQTKSLESTQEQIRIAQAQQNTILVKKMQIESLVGTPDTEKLLTLHKELTAEVEALEQKILSYSHRYISGTDLAKLLHDMTKKTDGVKIVDLSTAAINQPDVSSTEKPVDPQTTPLVEKTYYRLVLKGGYFAILDYLRRLEELSWRLYWDKFDYVVSEYPQGVVTISFYTLKEVTSQPANKAGSNQ